MTKDNKITAGSRLKECMEQRNLTLSSFSDLINKKAGLQFTTQFISQLRTGYRRITEQNAFMFADLLDIDSGYLLGKDNFSASSYEEYISFMDDLKKQEAESKKWKQQYKDDKANLNKYSHYLKGCGYKVLEARFTPDGKLIGFLISYKGNEALVPEAEMQKLKKRVDEYIRLWMNPLMDKYQVNE